MAIKNLSELKICFLFGSGISYAAQKKFIGKQISVEEITKQIFEGTFGRERFKPVGNRSYDTRWEYWIDHPFIEAPVDSYEVVIIKGFLRNLQTFIGRTLNYEEFFGLVNSLGPLARPELKSEFLKNFYPHYSRPEDQYLNFEEWTKKIEQIARLSGFYIQCVVKSLLAIEPTAAEDIPGLKLISDLAKRIKGIDIITLNHDLLVERQLQNAGIEFSDGFSRVGSAGFAEFTRSFRNKVKIYKLHGSINWFNVKYDPGEPWFYEITIRDRNNDKSKTQDKTEEREALFITGTDKERQYSQQPFKSLFYLAEKRLEEYDKVFVCGYGFGDEGINNMLRQWLRKERGSLRDGGHQLVLLNNGPLPENYFCRKVLNPLARLNNYNTDPFYKYSKWLSEITWEDFLQKFFNEEWTKYTFEQTNEKALPASG